MENLKQMHYKQIDLYFNEINEYKSQNNEFWCGYSLAMFQIEVTNAFNKGFITLEQSNFLCRCGNYASINL